MMKKKITYQLISTITIVIIIFMIANQMLMTIEKKSNEPEPEVVTIDDRISPLVNQGLIVEILRIRDRDIIDQMMNSYFTWRKDPVFYFVCTIDDLEYNSRDVVSATDVNDEPFNVWDTILLENKMSANVEEEQETSLVTIDIFKQESSKLFGLKKEYIKKEHIELVYNYRIGRWSGDDFLFDSDGYGHYLGDDYEIWFNIYQTDFDGDGIPYWTEVNVLNTNPKQDDSELDPDEDGITTSWEWKWSYDPFSFNDHLHLDPDMDGIENVEEFKMEQWFSNPFQQNIYIEADGMESDGLFDKEHVLYEEAKQIVIERFSQHGIILLIDFGWPSDASMIGGGELLSHHETVSGTLGTLYQYYKHHFSEDRIGIFRYFVIAHSSGYATTSIYNRPDTFSVDDGRNIMWKLTRRAYTPRLKRLCQASTIMHELGHTLGLLPYTFEGCDNMSFAESSSEKRVYLDTWGDYYSAMNYYYIFDYKLIDYSDGSNGSPYDQNDWDEIYLPTFQSELVMIEDPTYNPPAHDLVHIEETGFYLDDWSFSENLTKQFMDINNDWSPIHPIKCSFAVYIKNDSDLNDTNQIRVYAQPIFHTTIVTPSEWILLFEGTSKEMSLDDLEIYHEWYK